MESQNKHVHGSCETPASRFGASPMQRRSLRRSIRNITATAGVAVLGLSLVGGAAAAATLDDGADQAVVAEEQVAPETTETTDPEQADATAEDPEAPAEEADGAKPSGEDEAPATPENEKAETPSSTQDAKAEEAAAEDGDGDVQFDGVTIVEDEQFDRGAVQVEFSFQLPDGMRAGDTTTLVYPELLRYDNSKEAVIALEDGTILAHGTLTDPANRVITFTFTDVVDRYRDIKVRGHFGMIVDDPAANTTAKEFVFVQNGVEFSDTLITKPAERPPLTHVYIYGDWNAEDRGRDVPEGAITWTANLPEGEWAGQTVTVTPSNGTSLLDCSTVEFFTTQVADGAIYHSSVYDENQSADGKTPSYAEVVSCSADELVVTYSEPVDENFVRQIKVQAAVVDTDTTSQFGINIANSDLELVEGGADIAPSTWYNFVARDVGVGGGEGTTREGVISLEKYSTADGLEAGDYDSAPGKALTAGQEERITFEIVNVGNEPLTDLTLVDETLSGTPLEMGECTLDGVVLEPGDVITCEGLLRSEAPGTYSDVATVTAVTVRDGTETSDSDEWHGTVPAPEPTPDPSTDPEPDPEDTPEQPDGSLATTGTDAGALPWVLGGTAVLLMAGATALIVARRRAASTER